MAGRLWIAALLIAVTMACGEAVAPAPPVPVQESVVVVPAAQNDPDALPYLVSLNNEVGSASDYRGVQSLESNILESDVIARVSYLRKQSSSVLRPDHVLLRLDGHARVQVHRPRVPQGDWPRRDRRHRVHVVRDGSSGAVGRCPDRRRARQQMGQQGSHRVPVFAQQRGRTDRTFHALGCRPPDDLRPVPVRSSDRIDGPIQWGSLLGGKCPP